MRPRPGELVRVDGAASVQFAGDRALTLRVVAILDDRPTFDGWIWLSGYVVDGRGLAVAKRELFVQLAGLRRAGTPAPGDPRTARATKQQLPRRSARGVLSVRSGEPAG